MGEGAQNTAIGTAALLNNTTGSFNTATGAAALVNNTEGNANTAVGDSALLSNITGVRNTAVGYKCALHQQRRPFLRGGILQLCVWSLCTVCQFHWPLQHRIGHERTGIQHYRRREHGHWLSIAKQQHDRQVSTQPLGRSAHFLATPLATTTLPAERVRSLATPPARVTLPTAYSALSATIPLPMAIPPIGLSALENNTTGDENTAIGDDALL